MDIEIIFAESKEPDTSQFKECWPDAKITWIDLSKTARKWEGHWREGWRMNDYYKALGLLSSKADVAIAFDADMHIADEKAFKTLPEMASRWGLCLPANPRKLASYDNSIGADGSVVLEEPSLFSYAVNCSPIALNTKNQDAYNLVVAFACWMVQNPARGPVNWTRAIYERAFNPCLLPPQWCVCQEDVGIMRPILLHAGHEVVRKYYGLGEFSHGKI